MLWLFIKSLAWLFTKEPAGYKRCYYKTDRTHLDWAEELPLCLSSFSQSNVEFCLLWTEDFQNEHPVQSFQHVQVFPRCTASLKVENIEQDEVWQNTENGHIIPFHFPNLIRI
jgi:hypothetical protein